jgi:hypothetical protein
MTQQQQQRPDLLELMKAERARMEAELEQLPEFRRLRSCERFIAECTAAAPAPPPKKRTRAPKSNGEVAAAPAVAAAAPAAPPERKRHGPARGWRQAKANGATPPAEVAPRPTMAAPAAAPRRQARRLPSMLPPSEP